MTILDRSFWTFILLLFTSLVVWTYSPWLTYLERVSAILMGIFAAGVAVCILLTIWGVST